MCTLLYLQSLLSGSLDLAHFEQSTLAQSNQGHTYSGCPSHMSHGHYTYLDTEGQYKHCPKPKLEVPCQPNRTPGTNESAQICKDSEWYIARPCCSMQISDCSLFQFVLLTHIDAVFQNELPPSSSHGRCQGSRCWLGGVQLSKEHWVLDHLRTKELKGAKWPQSHEKIPDAQNLTKSRLLYSPRWSVNNNMTIHNI